MSDLERRNDGHDDEHEGVVNDGDSRHGSELEIPDYGTDAPIEDPGIEHYGDRDTDVSEAAARRAERWISAVFGLATLCSIGFVVLYFLIPRDAEAIFGPLHVNASNFGLGLTLGLALALVGVGAIQWARRIMSDTEVVEERHPAGSSEADRLEFRKAFEQGAADSRLGRRRMIGFSAAGALGVIVLPAIVLLKDLDTTSNKNLGRTDKALSHTIWARGVRIVNDGTGVPIKPADLVIGQLVNAQPANLDALRKTQGDTAYQNAKAKCPVIMVRMQPSDLQPPAGRENWGVDGIVAFSKICSHAGCPISLYEQQTHHVLCPCHQSTFDLSRGAKVVFGPAGHPLPQLPIKVDGQGYLVAQHDFDEPVGPSFFWRGS